MKTYRLECEDDLGDYDEYPSGNKMSDDIFRYATLGEEQCREVVEFLTKVGFKCSGYSREEIITKL